MKNNQKSFSCCVKIEFDAAHRVIGHSGKCKYLHGHRYVLETTAQSDLLDEMGMVVDFGILKSNIKNWIDQNFDHNAILSKEDKSLGEAVSKITNQKIFYLPYNPTAENIAYFLKTQIFPEIIYKNTTRNFVISNVKLYETPNCHVIL